jgi:hypothetical protein
MAARAARMAAMAAALAAGGDPMMAAAFAAGMAAGGAGAAAAAPPVDPSHADVGGDEACPEQLSTEVFSTYVCVARRGARVRCVRFSRQGWRVRPFTLFARLASSLRATPQLPHRHARAGPPGRHLRGGLPVVRRAAAARLRVPAARLALSTRRRRRQLSLRKRSRCRRFPRRLLRAAPSRCRAPTTHSSTRCRRGWRRRGCCPSCSWKASCTRARCVVDAAALRRAPRRVP